MRQNGLHVRRLTNQNEKAIPLLDGPTGIKREGMSKAFCQAALD
jgi:hypothetical protein